MATRRQHIRNSRAYLEASFTPLVAEYAFDTTLNAIRVGDGSALGGILQKRWRYSFPVSPAQIAADQNNYNPTDLAIAETLFLTSDAGRTVTGIAGGGAGARVTLINRGIFDITLANASGSSTAANRFMFESDVVLRPTAAIELQYSAADSRWMRATGGNKISTIPQELLLAGVLTVSITTNVNDYAPAGVTLAQTLRISTDVSRNMTGLADPREGCIKTLINVGTQPLVLKNQDTGSSASNRFDFGNDVTLQGKQSATLRYDFGDQRWKLLAATAGAAVAAGAVTAQTLAASALGLSMVNGALVASVAGSALTVAIKTLAGTDPSPADPVWVLFRNTTAATGDYTAMAITAATSLVVSSGSSLGVSVNNEAFKIWLVGFNDAGTFRLGVINCRSGMNIYPLSGWGLASSTAEGGAGAADNAQTFYTGTAVTSKPYAVLGYMTWESGLTAVSTWSAGPTRAQLFGPGVPLPGSVIQTVLSVPAAVATGTGLIPFDDTIPQSGEGDQYLSQAIAPSSAASLLEIEAQLALTNSGNNVLAAAIFQDAIANALVAQYFGVTAGNPILIRVNHSMVAGTAASTTLKARAGAANASTTTFNGVAGGRYFGGATVSFLRVREIAA